MLRYAAWRLIQLVPTFLGITLITFAVIHLAPGEPTAGGEGEVGVSREAVEEFRRTMGLDEPLPTQYAHWLSRIVRLDFGRSLRDGRPVSQKLAEALPRTALLSALALLLVIAVGLPLGIHAALHPGSPLERTSRVVLFLLHAVPSFWAAVMLLELAGRTGWLPIQGWADEAAEALSPLGRVVDVAAHLVLPVLCLAYSSWASVARQVRGSLLEALSEDYVRTARAKGLPERAVVLRHALRNALLPPLTLIGTLVPHLLGGSVVVESVFGLPGMGLLGFEAVGYRDYNTLMATAVVGALVALGANLLADLLYAAVDPRLTHGSAR
jgi:peptide/nickel transport system permease protein